MVGQSCVNISMLLIASFLDEVYRKIRANLGAKSRRPEQSGLLGRSALAMTGMRYQAAVLLVSVRSEHYCIALVTGADTS